MQTMETVLPAKQIFERFSLSRTTGWPRMKRRMRRRWTSRQQRKPSPPRPQRRCVFRRVDRSWDRCVSQAEAFLRETETFWTRFQEQCAELHAVSLDQGSAILTKLSDECRVFVERRDDLLLSQRLFEQPSFECRQLNKVRFGRRLRYCVRGRMDSGDGRAQEASADF